MDTSKKLTLTDILNATDEQLNKLTTRHALTLYRGISRWVTHFWDDSTRGGESEFHSDLAMHKTAAERLKKLLDGRPHVPNKKASKALRQLAAKRKR
jgi:hypothetical protein